MTSTPDNTTYTTAPRKTRAPGGWLCGESHPKSKLSDEQVRVIRRMKSEGMTYRAIGEAMGVSMWTVRDICQFVTRINA
jgi:DNA-binding NarL/FixJ family response regulator